MRDGGPVRLEATVRGVVQGVGFRWFAMDEARSLGLVGWVANRRDGAVECVAEGPRADLESFLERLREGPAGALVERVDVVWQPIGGRSGLRSFGIRSGDHRGD